MTEQLGELLESLSELFNSLVEVDFSSGTLDYDLLRFLEPDRTNNRTDELHRQRPGWNVQDAYQDILRQETSQDIKHSEIGLYDTRTRHAMDRLFADLGGKIALAVPTWNFWQHTKEFDKKNFSYFTALDDDQLVENYKHLLKTDTPDSMVVVSTSNPLSIDHREETFKEINRLSTKYGVQIIVDDLVRGIRPTDDRDSIGRHFDNPIIVEGLSHRFGEPPGKIPELTFIYTPGRACPYGDNYTEKEAHELGVALTAIHEILTPQLYEELRARNDALDEVIGEELPDVPITRAFDSALTTRLDLPEHYGSGKDVTTRCYQQGIKVLPYEPFYPDEYKGDQTRTEHLLRLSPGWIPKEQMTSAAKKFTEAVKRQGDVQGDY